MYVGGVGPFKETLCTQGLGLQFAMHRKAGLSVLLL